VESPDPSIFLTHLATWLRAFGADVGALLPLIESPETPATVKRPLVGGLNYLFRALDLIPDGLEDIGYVDDLFVLRRAAVLAKNGLVVAKLPVPEVISRMADNAQWVLAWLETMAIPFEEYCAQLMLDSASARGRTVGAILTDANVLGDFLGDLRVFVGGFQPPPFASEDRTLVKLRAYFSGRF
jgi:uncharacterized membrane protein YkvA (DUF1232 family)